MDKMEIYNRLPISGQNFACYCEGKRIVRSRYGNLFWKKLSEYEERHNWSYDHLCDYRDMQLRKLVTHAYRTVPYYTDLFNNGGINPEEIKRIDDLKRLPILTKDIIKKNPDAFLSTVFNKKQMVTLHTSGTTGNGFVFKATQEAICDQWAVWWRYRRAIGIQYEEWCALLGGRSVVPISQNNPPYFRWNKPCKQMYFSTYHMNESNLGYYVKAIEENKIDWIHGYPSAINLLADYMIQNNQKMEMEYITTGAENLLESQKEKIKTAFRVEPYQHYGLSEGTANFSEDRNHKMFVDEDYAAVEFIENDSGAFSIVGTNLTNYAMPFIRYNTDDVCSIEVTNTGRIITSLDGRKEEYLVLSDGTKVGRLDHIFKDAINVREAQFIQGKPGKAVLKIVKGKGYSQKDEDMLNHEMQTRLKEISIDIQYVEQIERTKNGKFRFVTSE